MSLSVEEEAKEIEKYIKHLIKEHGDAFDECYKHILLYGSITEEDIERIVLSSLNKRVSTESKEKPDKV